MEPAHEEDAQRQAVRDQHQVGVGSKAPRVDVTDELREGDREMANNRSTKSQGQAGLLARPSAT